MTTLPEAKQAILETFVGAWDPAVAYTFENEDFTPPSDAPWARLVIRHEDSGQETLGPVGNRKFARLGRVLVQVFTPEDQGTLEADTLAVVVRNAFEGVTLASTTVRFRAVTTREVGSSADDAWFLSIVDAPFEYDETR